MVVFQGVLVQHDALAAADDGSFPSRQVFTDGEYAAGGDEPAATGEYAGATAGKAASSDGVDVGSGAPAVL